MYEGWNFYGLEMGWKLSLLPTANDLINHGYVIMTSIKAPKGEWGGEETSNLHDEVKILPKICSCGTRSISLAFVRVVTIHADCNS